MRPEQQEGSIDGGDLESDRPAEPPGLPAEPGLAAELGFAELLAGDDEGGSGGGDADYAGL